MDIKNLVVGQRIFYKGILGKVKKIHNKKVTIVLNHELSYGNYVHFYGRRKRKKTFIVFPKSLKQG